jgi:hypothetical protein
MKRVVFNIRFLLIVGLALAAGVWPMAGQAASLGTAARFAVLARTAVTCTGPNSNVTGPVGRATSSTAITKTGCTMAVQTAAAAYANFLNTYKAGLGPCGTTLGSTMPGVTTLASGTYCTPAALTLTGGTLNLTGNGPWNFEIGTGGTGALTTTDYTVVSSNPCNVFWWVSQAVTLKFTAAPLPGKFQGTLMAGADITLTDTSLTGRAWAGGAPQTAVPNGAVTLTRSPILGCTAAGTVPGQKCTKGEGNDADKDSDKSEDTADRSAPVKSASEGASDSSHPDGKDDNNKHSNDNDESDNSKKGCDSDESDKDKSHKSD